MSLGTQSSSRLNSLIDGDGDTGGDGEEATTNRSRSGSSAGKIAGKATVAGTGKAVKSGGKLLVAIVGWKVILISAAVLLILVLLLILGLAIGASLDDESDDCTPDGSSIDVGDIDPNEEAHAKAIHKVFSAKGMSNENIAGILGNWSQESANDPTRLQGDNTDPYKMTAAKKKRAEGFTKGIGLAQWTGDRNSKLRKYAEEKNKNWWSPSLQLNFMTDPKGDNPDDVAIVKDMVKNPLDSPKAATEHFHDKWERSGVPNMSARIEQAEKWYKKMKTWSPKADAQSVDAQGTGSDEAIAGGNVTQKDEKIPDLGVKPHAQEAAQVIKNEFPAITGLGGYRESAKDPGGHPSGLAVDFMVPLNDEGKKLGDDIAKFAQDNREELNVDYIIWYQKIWHADKPGQGWTDMEDRGGDTANHKDHPHINFTKEAKGDPNDAVSGGGSAGSDEECEDDAKGGGEAPKGSGKFIHPAPGAPLTSPFGYRVHPISGKKKLHAGQDYGVACGTTLYAVDAGKVIFAGWQSGYGNRVEIDHGKGIITTYSHNTSLIVKKGDTVKQKDKISLSGTTGASTGCHLHFEVKKNGKYVDPLGYLPK